MISILILTKNEESNIARCIESVRWASEIFVLDSMSTDKTTEIATSLGAKVVQREFDNWSAHQNWAVKNISFANPWVFYLDADEECDDELRSEIEKMVGVSSDVAAFRLRRKDYFMGRWLRRSQLYPTWLVRVFRHDRIRYERLVNPVAIVDGETGTLNGHLIHHPFSHGVAHWFDRHYRYSSFEAEDLLREVSTKLDIAGLFSTDSTRRRKALKNLAYRMPARPFLMFIYLFFVRAGFLDGFPGFYYSAMRASYELMIDVKVQELRWRKSGQQSGSR